MKNAKIILLLNTSRRVILLCVSFLVLPLYAQTVSTFAGSGTGGSVNATGTAASFSGPSGIAVDGSGNIYVGDANNHKIRKITVLGVVTTLAGSGTNAFADGTGAGASFFAPRGVAVDGLGNVYVADQLNHRIRKITTSGVVTTLAGSGAAAFADGSGVLASFNSPFGIAVDAAGNVYVADATNHRIRKITSVGVVTTFAGSGTAAFADGTGSAASFNFPQGIAIDAAGNIYVADNANNRIRKITSGGVVTTVAGSSTGGGLDGIGTAATFFGPQAVTVDGAGNIYVADKTNHTIRMISSSAVVTTIAGTLGTTGSAEGVGVAASFNFPFGVAIDGIGSLFVADRSNNKIRKTTIPCSIPPTPIASTVTQPTCAVPTGTILITAPTGGYQYSVDGITYQSSTSFSFLASNTSYNVTARDAANSTCISANAVVSVNAVLLVPSTPVASTTVQPTCGIPTGTILVSAPIGSVEYSSDGSSYQVGNSFSALAANTSYPISARNSADHTCITPALNVSVNAVPSIPAAPTASTTVQPTFITPTGTIEVTAPIGSFDYSLDGNTYQTATSFTSVAPGMTHSLTSRSSVDNTCVSTSTSVLVDPVPTPTSMLEGTTREEEFIGIFPNPAKDEVFIQFAEKMEMESTVTILIFNCEGIVVAAATCQKFSNISRINVNNLRKGIYCVALITEHSYSTEKLLLLE